MTHKCVKSETLKPFCLLFCTGIERIFIKTHSTENMLQDRKYTVFAGPSVHHSAPKFTCSASEEVNFHLQCTNSFILLLILVLNFHLQYTNSFILLSIYSTQIPLSFCPSTVHKLLYLYVILVPLLFLLGLEPATF